MQGTTTEISVTLQKDSKATNSAVFQLFDRPFTVDGKQVLWCDLKLDGKVVNDNKFLVGLMESNIGKIESIFIDWQLKVSRKINKQNEELNKQNNGLTIVETLQVEQNAKSAFIEVKQSGRSKFGKMVNAATSAKFDLENYLMCATELRDQKNWFEMRKNLPKKFVKDAREALEIVYQQKVTNKVKVGQPRDWKSVKKATLIYIYRLKQQKKWNIEDFGPENATIINKKIDVEIGLVKARYERDAIQEPYFYLWFIDWGRKAIEGAESLDFDIGENGEVDQGRYIEKINAGREKIDIYRLAYEQIARYAYLRGVALDKTARIMITLYNDARAVKKPDTKIIAVKAWLKEELESIAATFYCRKQYGDPIKYFAELLAAPAYIDHDCSEMEYTLGITYQQTGRFTALFNIDSESDNTSDKYLTEKELQDCLWYLTPESKQALDKVKATQQQPINNSTDVAILAADTKTAAALPHYKSVPVVAAVLPKANVSFNGALSMMPASGSPTRVAFFPSAKKELDTHDFKVVGQIAEIKEKTDRYLMALCLVNGIFNIKNEYFIALEFEFKALESIINEFFESLPTAIEDIAKNCFRIRAVFDNIIRKAGLSVKMEILGGIFLQSPQANNDQRLEQNRKNLINYVLGLISQQPVKDLNKLFEIRNKAKEIKKKFKRAAEIKSSYEITPYEFMVFKVYINICHPMVELAIKVHADEEKSQDRPFGKFLDNIIDSMNTKGSNVLKLGLSDVHYLIVTLGTKVQADLWRELRKKLEKNAQDKTSQATAATATAAGLPVQASQQQYKMA